MADKDWGIWNVDGAHPITFSSACDFRRANSNGGYTCTYLNEECTIENCPIADISGQQKKINFFGL